MDKEVRFKQTDEFFIVNAISALMRHRFLIIWLVVLTIGAILVEHKRNPRYKISSRLHIQSTQDSPIQSMSAKLGGFTNRYDPVDYPEKYLKLLRTNRFYSMIGSKIRTSSLYPKLQNYFDHSGSSWFDIFRSDASSKKIERRYSDREIGAQISRWIQFKKSDYDTISVVGVMPEKILAAGIVNIVTTEAVTAINDYEIKELNEAEYYLQIELNHSKERIAQIDEIITKYKKQSKRVSLNLSRGGDSSTDTSDIKKDIDTAEVEIRHNKLLIEELERFKDEQLRKLSTTSRDPAFIPTYKGGVIDRIKNLQLENKFLESKRVALKEKLEEIINSKDLQYEQKIFDFKKQIELEYSLYQTLKREVFQTSIQRISIKNRVRVFDEASFEQARPAISLTKKILFALIFALTVVGILIYTWEYFFPRIQNRFDMERLGLTFLGRVPNLNKGANPLNRINISNDPKLSSVLCRFDTDSIGATAFRYLRTKILNIAEFQNKTRNKKANVIATISASTGDGKSIIATNLALCLAHMNQRVLLIDCDFRRASQTQILHLKGRHGLAEVLRGKKTFVDVVAKDVFPNLDVIGSGKRVPHATELLASWEFADLVNKVRNQYDMVILDTPAFDAGPDAIIAAKLANLPLVVGFANKTTVERVMNVVEGLATVDFDRVYAILNGDEHFSNNYIYAMPSGASGMFDDTKARR